MKDVFKAIVFTVSLTVLLAACGGGGDSPPNTNTPPDTSIYVDSVSGNDGNAGTSSAPYKTITFALAAAGPNKTIRVRPGAYNAANGEVFPLVLQANQILIGDEANKGGGTTPTLIIGSGATALGALGRFAAIIGAEGAQVSGFNIGDVAFTVFYAAIVVDGITMQISNNTFNTNTYAGIDLANNGTSIIENNVFDTSSYGLYVSNCPDAPIVRNNTFFAMGLPFTISGAATNIVISGNTISGNGQVGIQVAGGTPLIENNTINKATGYTYGAVRIMGIATPKLRGNVFACDRAIQIDSTGAPDLGTAIDPGNNDFTGVMGVNGVSVTHNGTVSVNAIGNTWPNVPPSCVTDIVINNGGVITWGSNPGNQCI